MKPVLPIDALLPEVRSAITASPALVIEAPPGAGKTTRVPPALLGCVPGEILVLEPRRLAARMAARRVAFELGERPGETAGYQVRFEEVAGRGTRIRFMTEGVLTRRLLSDPVLRGVSAVILDEFHERHLDGDFALALLEKLQRTRRRDLKLMVMSATLDAAPVASYLGGCPVVRSEGRLFDLAISYTPHSPAPLEEQAAGALATLMAEGLVGDVLVFLPGAAEIHRVIRACSPAAARAGFDVLPLFGDLSPEEQDRAVAPGPRPKVIVSTNVAESSVTIEGVRAVIDSGLARIASDSPWSGLPSLEVRRISKASATQRAGRAGRTGPGRVIRLYTAEDYARRPDHDTPEVLRRELSQMLLDMAAMQAEDLRWLDAPPSAAVDAAGDLLGRLGALDAAGRLTPAGGRMAKLPLHPRLSRMVVEGIERGAGEDACDLAALLGEGREASPDGDVVRLLDREWTGRARQAAQQIRRAARPPRQTGHRDEALRMAVLTGFPDRVARRTRERDLLLASGGSAVLEAAASVPGQFLVAVDIEQRRERGLPLVRLACSIEPEWLLDLFPGRVREENAVEWNRAAERVDAVGRLMYDGLAIEESRGAMPDPEQAARLLAERALEAGVARFADQEEVDRFLARVAFASQHSALTALTGDDVREALVSLCEGLRSFAELKNAAGNSGLLRALEARLPARARRDLEEIAPDRLRLPSGRSTRVNYSPHQPPWVASRLQDFFGLRETPRVGRGAVPLVLHLLAPNQRPVQTTTDLAGFWTRLYPQVRKELGRRYPRHAWPEKPD